jgi:sulfopropanediol 3-dehydrogenase
MSAADPVSGVVAEIIAAVRERGDDAVRECSARLDGWAPEDFRLSDAQVQEAIAAVAEEDLEDIRFAQEQVRRFAEAQRGALQDIEVETRSGVRLGQRIIPVANVGAYVPGGRYPMVASAHMSIVTARAAGVERVIGCTPPLEGRRPTATVAAMHLAGADEIYVLGGVQAVAAMALGTTSIGAVDLLVGPGNAYVAEAKRQLYGDVGIDLLAGPTEILVIADDTADPELVAADLISQAEHGPTSPAVLVTTSARLAEAAAVEVERQLGDVPAAAPAWRDHGEIRVVADLEEAAAMSDALAFEHVEVLVRDPRQLLDRLRNYGSLFLGEQTTVSYGDKTIGTNHILPTAGAARYTGGLSVGKFLKTVTYQECTPAASVEIGTICARQSRLERFEGHARACDLRVRKFGAASARQAADGPSSPSSPRSPTAGG